MFRKYLARMALFVFVSVLAPNLFGVENKTEETEEVELEAVKCWLKSDKSSVRVGEKINITLTCRTVETDADKAVINEAPLDPSAVSFAPFEVVTGTRFQDIKKGELRFLQYQYTLTFMGEEFFGKEILIPGPEISYKVERKSLKSGESIDTREKIYNLSGLPVKIQSLVPKDAKDIREGNNDTFGEAAARNLHAKISFIAGSFFLLTALSIFSLALARSVGRRRAEKRNETAFSNSRLLGRIIRDLKRTRRMAEKDGWDSELIGKVLLVFRIAGAVALSRKVSQLSTELDKRGFEGQLKLRKGILKPKKVMISAGLTLEEMKNSGQVNEKWTGEFIKVFEAFNQSRYKEIQQADPGELNKLLQEGIKLVKRQKIRNSRFLKPVLKVKSKVSEWIEKRGLKWKK